MTRYISMRAQDVGGPVCDPVVLEWDGRQPVGCRPVSDGQLAASVSGRNVVLAVHGFNVSLPKGVISLGRLEEYLALGESWCFFGVLWPGDFWLPVVNYPSEAADAVRCGRRLAAYVDRWMASAASISLVSHSLGGRLALETVQGMQREPTEVCVTAAAVDRDCLSGQYGRARDRSGRLSVLSSRADKVLGLAYPLGDMVSDLLLGDDDSPWRRALGLVGPVQPAGPRVAPKPIPEDEGYGHGDYFPPSAARAAASPQKWPKAADYMRRALTGQDNQWPINGRETT